MRLDAWLKESSSTLQKLGILTARLDCLVLLEDITSKDRSWLLAHPDYKLTSSKVKKLESWKQRRIKHEPLAYIRGRTEFYGRQFIVSPDTLEPRPESEAIVDSLHKLMQPKNKKLKIENGNVVIDIGTGSGCLAITAKLELPDLQIIATDILKSALKIARQNAKKHKVNIEFHQGNLLQALPPNSQPKIIIANLPYVPDSHIINQAATHEPKIAIFGGHDGLKYYRELFVDINKTNEKPIYIITESLPTQHKDLELIALHNGYKQIQKNDFIQTFMATV